jgi:hypothetical protein
MATAVARGSYYKTRSKKWLEAQGFAVCALHITGWLKTAEDFVPFTRDGFGADLLAMSPAECLLIQVKGGTDWRSQLAAARRRFAGYPLAPGCAQVIHGWAPHAREPEVLIVAEGPQAADRPVLPLPRRKPKLLPLFARPA